LSDRALSRGYFRRKEVETLLMQHEQTGTHPKEVFSLLVSELWHRQFVEQSGGHSHSPLAATTVR
jgi:asparagine synthase (glutamine-hydrolysing)